MATRRKTTPAPAEEETPAVTEEKQPRAQDTSNMEWVAEIPAAPARTGRGRRSAFEAYAEKLEANPENWARVGVKVAQGTANAAAVNIRKRPGFEATVREVDGQFHVYARYMGF